MENIIREGELQLLMSETPSDVILSCQGRKLSAHKVILAFASPVLQELLMHASSDTAMLIFPDVNGNTMSLILDYIYRGNVTITAYNLAEFISTASLLKLHLDYDSLEQDKHLIKTDFSTLCNFIEKKPSPDHIHSIKELTNNVLLKRQLRKIPNLMPIPVIEKGNNMVSVKKGLYNRVFPSPWCPRIAPMLADPREDYSLLDKSLRASQCPKEASLQENDSNNNFQLGPVKSPHPTPNNNNHRNNSNNPSLERKSKFQALHPSADLSSVHTEAVDEHELHLCEKPLICQLLTEKNSDHDISRVHAIEVSVKAESSPRASDEEAVNTKKNPEDKQKPFKCQDCGKSFSQLRNYKYHRSIHEGTKEFAARCPECGKVFNDRGYLSSHLKIHRDRKEYACPNCPKRFNQRVAYNMHLRIHTGVKPHECPTCGKTFSRKMLLKQHQRVHTGERPYSCPECGKSFADRSNMSLHARLHTGVKPYVCNLCSKSFTKKHHLKTHMNFHTGLKPYSCQKCGLAFSQSSNMRTHYKKCILKSSTINENS